MTRLRRRFKTLCLAVLLVAPAASGQVLPFEILGLRDGLPQSQVACFAQDRDGYIWVGTWGGLARYNGQDFVSFFQGPELASDRVQGLLACPDGDLWVATAGGLSLYKDHRLSRLADPLLADVRCRALALDGKGVLWIGTDKGVVFRRGDSFERIALGAEAGKSTIYDILAGSDGLYAAGDPGLWRLRAGAEPEAFPGPPGVNPGDFRALAETAEGLWLGSYSNGLWLRDASGWRRATAVSARSVYRIMSGLSGTLYVATNGDGLFVKPAGRAEFNHWDTSNGLPSNVVNFAAEDREGNLWVGTDIGGLARLGGTSISNHTVKQGLPDSCVFGISAGDTPDSLWLGTLKGAVHYRVRPTPKVLEILQSADGLVNEWVWKVRRLADGTLWILTDTAVHFRRPGEKRLRDPAPDIPLPRAVPWDMTEDFEGRLWFCGSGRDGGLTMRDRDGRWRAWNRTEDGRVFDYCHHLTPRRRGGVWAVFGRDIYSCDGRTVNALSKPAPLGESSQANALFEDSRGRLWAGTDAALARMGTDGRWEILNDRPGLTNRHVFFLGEDSRGTVWVCTARGVFRFRSDDRIDPFTPDDGLADWEMNQYGFYCDPRNEVWLGTVSGLSQYAPQSGSENRVPPLLTVEAVDLPGRTVPFPDALDLSWKERTLNFHVAILSFRNKAKTVYRARMENLEEDWTSPRRLAELRYTNMPPGRFTLLIQAANESGAWSEPLRLPIRVRPPFWRTAVFQGAALVLLLAAAFGAHGWRMALIRRRNRELEAEVALRTEDLKKANDRLTYLATYDPLTGLLNRRAVMETIGREAEPETGGNRQFGCALADLNKFKQANDTLGHAAGDQVLKDMARQLKACLRDSDSLGRIGGDEFLIVMPGADLEAVRSVCRRISAALSAASGDNKTVVVTASCGGIAVPSRAGATAAVVLAQADALLYKIKRAGGGSEVGVFDHGWGAGDAGG